MLEANRPEPPKYGVGATALPYPTTFETSSNQRGSGRLKANGSMAIQFVDSALKRTWTLQWSNASLLVDDMAAIETFVNMLSDGSIRFYPPQENGGTAYYDVTRDERLTELRWSVIRDAAGKFRFTGSITLREV